MGETRQRLAHRSPGHAELQRQRRLLQRLPRRQLRGTDQLAQVLVSLVGKAERAIDAFQ